MEYEKKARVCLILHPPLLISLVASDATTEAEALTRDLFGWKRKQKRKQLNQTASASSYYIAYTVP